jgi:hypothetical protein
MYVSTGQVLYVPSSAASAAIVRKKRRSVRKPPVPLEQVNLNRLRIDRLRRAIQANRVSFPSTVPTFEHHDRPDLQRKMAQLYFVMGWSRERIGDRYGLIHQRVSQILRTWKRRAVETGYIQYIPPVDRLRIAVTTTPAQLPDFAFLPVPPPFHAAPASAAAESLAAH